MWNNFVKFLESHNIIKSDVETVRLHVEEFTNFDLAPMQGEVFKGCWRIKATPKHSKYDLLWDKRMLVRKAGERWQYAIIDRQDNYETPPDRLTWNAFE